MWSGDQGKIRPPPKPLRKRPSRPKKSVSRLNRPESEAKSWWVNFSFRHRQKPFPNCRGVRCLPSWVRIGKPEENMSSIRSYTRFMSLHLCRRHMLFGVLRLHPHAESNYSPAGIFSPDISDWTAAQHALTIGHRSVFLQPHTDTQQHN